MSRAATLRRRALSVPGVAATAVGLGTTAPVWLPVAGGVDLLRARDRMPRVRLLSFALAWSTLETMGVAAAGSLWAAGRRRDLDAHYGLQRWWADRLLASLAATIGLRFEVRGADALADGPVVMLTRHASIADALLPMHLLTGSGLRPHYVLKRELAADPCLDIVGRRLPNHFVDRTPDDGDAELGALTALGSGLRSRDAAIIYPEGMVVDDARRARAIETVSTRSPERRDAVDGLRHVAPVRPGGARALLFGAAAADAVFVAHHGFEPLGRLAGAPGAVPLTAPVRVDVRRVPRADIPDDAAAFTAWLDAEWRRVDDTVTELAAR